MIYTELQKPEKFECIESSLTDSYGEFIAEPFERGFALTIGNSLRRVLLAGLEGTAVTSIKIDGVYHEFSTISGVVEDLTEIILNIKKLNFRVFGDKERIVHLKKEGPGEAYSKDIICGQNVEIVDPNQFIAKLDKDGKLDIEMTVKKGIGFVPAENNRSDDLPIGTIPIDSIFSPIVKVNYRVENTRKGGSLDYERLILQITTDGSISPQEAFLQACQILKEYYNVFIKEYSIEGEEINQEELEEDEKKEEEEVSFNQNLLKKVSDLELSVRAANCLQNANIATVAEMVVKTEDHLMKMKNFGKKSFNQIRAALKEMDLDFGIDLSTLPPKAQEIIKKRNADVRKQMEEENENIQSLGTEAEFNGSEE
ncbi:MAG: DNA-directed RNA polymerase subunit alpha [bacterium]